MPNDEGWKTLEAALINVGVGIVAAAIGVWGGVRVHGAEIEEIKRRVERIERKQDRMLEHFAIRGIEGED